MLSLVVFKFESLGYRLSENRAASSVSEIEPAGQNANFHNFIVISRAEGCAQKYQPDSLGQSRALGQARSDTCDTARLPGLRTLRTTRCTIVHSRSSAETPLVWISSPAKSRLLVLQLCMAHGSTAHPKVPRSPRNEMTTLRVLQFTNSI